MKKLIKIVGLILLIIVSIPIIGLIVSKISNNSFMGSADKEFVEYLNQNKKVLDSQSISEMDLLFDIETYDSKVVLLGEIHGYGDVQEIDRIFFIHLNKTKGTRYYLAEIDSIGANILNNYLNSEIKDSAMLRSYVDKVKQRIVQQAGHELFHKWSQLYDYNQLLADSLKIKVIGIDKSIGDKSGANRDSVMVVNFINTIEKHSLQDESFYGHFGLFHVLQSGINSNNVQTLASKLKNKGYDVSSILCFDVDSEVYLPKNAQFPTPSDEKTTLMGLDGPIAVVKGINDLKAASIPNTNTLFYLNNENSPYRSSSKLMNIKMNFLGGDFAPYDSSASAIDFFQYIVFLRNAKATTPFKD